MFVNIDQNTEEWHFFRLGKITASNFGSVMANEGKAFGDPAKKYAERIALEIVTGRLDESSGFSNSFMDRGHELEPVAKELYELETIQTVKNGGFHYIENYIIKIGASPDGLVGQDGLIEIKSVIPHTQFKTIKRNSFDPSYKWQLYGHLLITGRKWCDFVSYCPEMPEKKRLIIHRVERDEETLNRLKNRLIQFIGLIQENINLLND